ncbi:glycosyltransferase family 87 protein [Mycobacterium kubicae]|uniref:glycosyltransferase family 87 protein n=1 Tax=Mycobacterium kubicae TaxID=120959 RepID=UPI000AA76D36|nr:glycosyltransferase family 87 protein [Mycobacterium kubicae]
MNRPLNVLRGARTATRARIAAVTSQSERTLLLGAILLGSALSAAIAYILTQCYAVDVVSTLLLGPQDCWLDWEMKIGRHCFSDYAMVVSGGVQPNPAEYVISLPPDYKPTTMATWAPARLPYSLFGSPAHWLAVPRLGLVCYLLALTISVISPALWAARGTQGLERVVVFVTLGVAAIPAWGAIDRGNSTGFLVPIALVYLVALARQRWGLVTITIVLAALLKPQFVVLGVVLLTARQWRWAGIGIVGVVISNIGAFLLWPQGFPGTIPQSIQDLARFNSSFGGLQDTRNVSFGRALLLIPDSIKTAQVGKLPQDFLTGPRTLIGFAILLVVVAAVVALGRRIPPVMAGIVLLPTATLSPSYAAFYYLVFALPIAALIVRGPYGPPGAGIFDQLAKHSSGRRAVGLCLTAAAVLSIVNIALPGQPFRAPIYGQAGVKGVIGSVSLVATTVPYATVFWLVAIVAILVSYVRRPAESYKRAVHSVREASAYSPVNASASDHLADSPPKQSKRSGARGEEKTGPSPTSTT